MAQNTRISWCNATHNFWIGCDPVSPGCARCYAAAWAERYGQNFAQVRRTKSFPAPLRWQKQLVAGTYCGPTTGGQVLVFTCSLSDFFLEEADAWRAEAWHIIRQTPHLTYQILTKRPERIRACLPPDWGDGYPGVWLGVSVENQRWTSRLDALCAVPAAVHFASVEPLLGPVDLAPWLDRLSWVIIGGESGPQRRPMALAWLLNVVTQCQAAGVAVWVKQASALRDGQQGTIPDAVWTLKQFPPPRQQGATLCL